MFNQPFKKPVQKNTEGCQIKVSRDKMGRVKSITTNGKCNKAEIDVFRENMNSIEKEVTDEN